MLKQPAAKALSLVLVWGRNKWDICYLVFVNQPALKMTRVMFRSSQGCDLPETLCVNVTQLQHKSQILKVHSIKTQQVREDTYWEKPKSLPSSFPLHHIRPNLQIWVQFQSQTFRKRRKKCQQKSSNQKVGGLKYLSLTSRISTWQVASGQSVL